MYLRFPLKILWCLLIESTRAKVQRSVCTLTCFNAFHKPFWRPCSRRGRTVGVSPFIRTKKPNVIIFFDERVFSSDLNLFVYHGTPTNTHFVDDNKGNMNRYLLNLARSRLPSFTLKTIKWADRNYKKLQQTMWESQFPKCKVNWEKFKKRCCCCCDSKTRLL
jgi:hypothetical protein